MTMQELAKLCNVSVSTVSKAFNEANDVSSTTKAMIFEKAKEQGCYSYFYKGKYQKKVIAIITPEIISNYYIKYVNVLRKKIENDNCVCLIATDDFDDNKKENLIEYFADYLKVDGIILFALSKKLKKDYNIPIVSIYSSVDESVDYIKLESNNALKKAVNLLLNNGHKNIAFFTEPLTESNAKKFEDIMTSLNHKDFYIIKSEKRFEKCGEECVKKLPEKVTAIICAYDNIAFGAIKALQKKGLSVPDDISVIGFNNIKESQYSVPPLTTIGSDTEKMCKTIWSLLKKKIRSSYYKIRTSPVIEAELFIRESVAKKKTEK